MRSLAAVTALSAWVLVGGCHGGADADDPLIAQYSLRWGPVTVQSGRRYEFAELQPGAPVHHFYNEPFVRSDHLIRLLESDALRLAGGPFTVRSCSCSC